jgi:hypothetical protein
MHRLLQSYWGTLFVAVALVIAPAAQANELRAEWHYQTGIFSPQEVSIPEPHHLRVTAGGAILNFSFESGVPTAILTIGSADGNSIEGISPILEANSNPRFTVFNRFTSQHQPTSSINGVKNVTILLVDWAQTQVRTILLPPDASPNQVMYVLDADFFVVYTLRDKVTDHTLFAYNLPDGAPLWNVTIGHDAYPDVPNLVQLSRGRGLFYAPTMNGFYVFGRQGPVPVPAMGPAYAVAWDSEHRRLAAFHAWLTNGENRLAIYDEGLVPTSVLGPPDFAGGMPVWLDHGDVLATVGGRNVSKYAMVGPVPQLQSRAEYANETDYLGGGPKGAYESSKLILSRRVTIDGQTHREYVWWDIDQGELGSVRIDAPPAAEPATGYIAGIRTVELPDESSLQLAGQVDVYSPVGSDVLPPVEWNEVTCSKDDSAKHLVWDRNETVRLPDPPIPGTSVLAFGIPAPADDARLEVARNESFQIHTIPILHGSGSVELSAVYAKGVWETYVIGTIIDGKHLQSRTCQVEWAFLDPGYPNYGAEPGHGGGSSVPIAPSPVWIAVGTVLLLWRRKKRTD